MVRADAVPLVSSGLRLEFQGGKNNTNVMRGQGGSGPLIFHPGGRRNS